MRFRPYDRIKILAVCKVLGMGQKEAFLFSRIHGVTECGRKGPEALERLDDIRRLERRANNPGKEGLTFYEGEALRIMSDPAYRQQKYDEYVRNIKPRIDRLTLADVYDGISIR